MTSQSFFFSKSVREGEWEGGCREGLVQFCENTVERCAGATGDCERQPGGFEYHDSALWGCL